MDDVKKTEPGTTRYIIIGCTQSNGSESTKSNMSVEDETPTIDGDSLLLLLRDAIVQHSPLTEIRLILR